MLNLDQYQFKTNNSQLDYEFDSLGPNGVIKKVVKFTPRNANGVTYFNLGFGDLDEMQDNINDKSISNNHDTRKVLATVAAAVVQFTSAYPDMMVYAQGSTPSRTRLYQIGIALNLNQIEPNFEVYGFRLDGSLEFFRKNVNYQAFIVKRKV